MTDIEIARAIANEETSRLDLTKALKQLKAMKLGFKELDKKQKQSEKIEAIPEYRELWEADYADPSFIDSIIKDAKIQHILTQSSNDGIICNTVYILKNLDRFIISVRPKQTSVCYYQERKNK